MCEDYEVRVLCCKSRGGSPQGGGSEVVNIERRVNDLIEEGGLSDNGEIENLNLLTLQHLVFAKYSIFIKDNLFIYQHN